MSDKLEKLKELKELLDKGLIDKTEYDALKSQLFGTDLKKNETKNIEIIKPDKVEVPLNIASKRPEAPKSNESAKPENTRLTPPKVGVPKNPDVPKVVPTKRVESTNKQEVKAASQKPSESTKIKVPKVVPPKVSLVPKVKGLKAIPPNSNVPRGAKNINVESKEKPTKIVLVPKGASRLSQEKTTSLAMDESAEKPKKGISSMRYIIIGLLVIAGVSVVTYFLNQESSAIEAEKSIATVDRYIIHSRLKLAKYPGEGGDIHYSLAFGEKIKVIKGSQEVIGDFTYVKVIHDNKQGWVSSKKKNVNLISELAEVEQIRSIITGPFAQKELESIAAYEKYTIMDLSKQTGGFVLETNGYGKFPMIQKYRSRMGNRSSSSDQRVGKNNEPKDMVFSARKNNGSRYVYVIRFDENYNPEVVFQTQVYAEIIGFERLRRKTKQEFYTYGVSDYGDRLKQDAIRVHDLNNEGFYIYAPNGSYDSYYN